MRESDPPQEEECTYHAFGDVTCKYGEDCRFLHLNLDRILIWTRKQKKVGDIKDLAKKLFGVTKIISKNYFYLITLDHDANDDDLYLLINSMKISNNVNVERSRAMIKPKEKSSYETHVEFCQFNYPQYVLGGEFLLNAGMIPYCIENDSLLLCQQFRKMTVGYDFPGGMIDHSDPTIFDAAWREFNEETYGAFEDCYDDIYAQLNRKSAIIERNVNVAAFVISVPFVEVETLVSGKTNLEILTYQWIKLDEIDDYLNNFHFGSRTVFQNNQQRIMKKIRKMKQEIK